METVEIHYGDGSVAYTEPLTVEQMDSIEDFLIEQGIRINIKT